MPARDAAAIPKSQERAEGRPSKVFDAPLITSMNVSCTRSGTSLGATPRYAMKRRTSAW